MNFDEVRFSVGGILYTVTDPFKDSIRPDLPHYHRWGAPLPYAHLALSLVCGLWAHCAFTGQEVSGVVLQPSHIMHTHTYTYMLTARGAYAVRYPILSNGLVVHKLTRPLREVECVGLREERGLGIGIERLVPDDFTARPSCCFFLSVINPRIHADIYCPTAQHTSCCWPGPNLAARVDRVLLAACQHSRAFNLLSDDCQ